MVLDACSRHRDEQHRGHHPCGPDRAHGQPAVPTRPGGCAQRQCSCVGCHSPLLRLEILCPVERWFSNKENVLTDGENVNHFGLKMVCGPLGNLHLWRWTGPLQHRF